MNIVEKEKWISKTVNLPLNVRNDEIEKIAALKEFLRANKLLLSTNQYGQILIKDYDQKVIGTAGPVLGGS